MTFVTISSTPQIFEQSLFFFYSEAEGSTETYLILSSLCLIIFFSWLNRVGVGHLAPAGMKLTDGGPKYYKLIGALMDKAEVTHGAKLKSNVCSHLFLQCFSTTTFSTIPYFISRYANSCKSNSELLVACLLLVRTEPLPRPLSRRSRRRATT